MEKLSQAISRALAVDVLVVNYNTAHLLDRFFATLFCASDEAGIHENFNVLAVDNASSDRSCEVLSKHLDEQAVITNSVNVGFGRANNQLLSKVSGAFILLVNTDAFVSPDSLSKTLIYMNTNPDVGILGVRLTDQDGGLQPSCRYFPTPFNVFLSRTGLGRFFPWIRLVDDMEWDHAAVRECDWVPGCYYLIRREVVDQVGLFDPRFFLYYEEVDHCKRVKNAGWKVVYYPYTTVIHIGGESAKSVSEISQTGRQISALQIESELLYFRKHYGRMGLIWHVALVGLGDFVLAVKALLKRRGRQALIGCWHHFVVVCRLLSVTRFATQPTR